MSRRASKKMDHFPVWKATVRILNERPKKKTPVKVISFHSRYKQLILDQSHLRGVLRTFQYQSSVQLRHGQVPATKPCNSVCFSEFPQTGYFFKNRSRTIFEHIFLSLSDIISNQCCATFWIETKLVTNKKKVKKKRYFLDRTLILSSILNCVTSQIASSPVKLRNFHYISYA